MIDPLQLAALTEVLGTGSFDAAAVALGVTQSAISQRIRALEESMGAQLILRGRPCQGTEAGLRLARHYNDIRLLEQALVRDLGKTEVARPTVRIAVNADSLATWLLPALTALPGVNFDLVIDDQDHSETLLRRAEVMAAIITRPEPLRGCSAWQLGSLRYVATASPEFVARHFPDGLTEQALARAPVITFNSKDSLQRQWLKRQCGHDLSPPSHIIGSSQAFVEAALLGLGWGMNPLALVQAHLQTGRLVALTPERPLDVSLTWQVTRLNAAILSPLTQAIRAAARAELVARSD